MANQTNNNGWHRNETLDALSRDFGMMNAEQRRVMGVFYDRAMSESSGAIAGLGPIVAARRVLFNALPDLVSALIEVAETPDNAPAPAEPAPEPEPEQAPPPGTKIEPADNPPSQIESAAPLRGFAALAASVSGR